MIIIEVIADSIIKAVWGSILEELLSSGFLASGLSSLSSSMSGKSSVSGPLPSKSEKNV